MESGKPVLQGAARLGAALLGAARLGGGLPFDFALGIGYCSYPVLPLALPFGGASLFASSRIWSALKWGTVPSGVDWAGNEEWAR